MPVTSATACVIAEPTGGAVIPANAGSLTFRLEVEGRAAHGSTRTLGESALDHLAVLQDALRELEARRNDGAPEAFAHLDLAAPISIGSVRSGTWASTVPDLLVAEGRYGVLPGEPLDDARSCLRGGDVALLGQQDPWLGRPPGAGQSGRVGPSPRVRCPWAPAARRDRHGGAQTAGRRLPRVEGAPYGSDLRHYAAHGVPTVQFGPGELEQAHAVDESVPVAELVACARAYALLALRRCGAPRQREERVGRAGERAG